MYVGWQAFKGYVNDIYILRSLSKKPPKRRARLNPANANPCRDHSIQNPKTKKKSAR
jgi:hypothetical protein